ncbi:MAG: endoribonuclease MazF [Patescibacteria group bacterium]
MVKKNYIPERGDLVWVNFNPTRGHEQSGKRPALVISTVGYNSKTNLAIVVPITSKEKGYPFEVGFLSSEIKGVVLSDQVRNIDWKDRKVEFISKINSEALKEVRDKLSKLID